MANDRISQLEIRPHGSAMYALDIEAAAMLPTRNHQEIRAWAERHKAIPAEISGTENGTPALLDFLLAYGLPRSRTLNIISWEDFFARFDILELSMAWDDGGQFTLVRVAPESPRRLTH